MLWIVKISNKKPRLNGPRPCFIIILDIWIKVKENDKKTSMMQVPTPMEVRKPKICLRQIPNNQKNRFYE